MKWRWRERERRESCGCLKKQLELKNFVPCLHLALLLFFWPHFILSLKKGKNEREEKERKSNIDQVLAKEWLERTKFLTRPLHQSFFFFFIFSHLTYFFSKNFAPFFFLQIIIWAHFGHTFYETLSLHHQQFSFFLHFYQYSVIFFYFYFLKKKSFSHFIHLHQFQTNSSFDYLLMFKL